MTIEDLFCSYKNKKIYVLLNIGNRGDGLIHMGGRALLAKHNIEYEEIRFPQDISGDMLFVYGCGAFSASFHHMVKFINFYINKFDKIYILPASFDISCREIREFISGVPEKIIIYCRERYSYQDLLKIATFKENIILDKDMAFYIDYSKWNRKGSGVLVSFRKDGEAASSFFCKYSTFYKAIIKVKLAFSGQMAKWDDVSNGGNETEGEALLQTIANYEEIYTDRAHVAIASAMMGKRTYIYPSCYHKQKGIYEYSLSHMSNVYWHNWGLWDM